MSELERRLIDSYQRDLPLEPEPFRAMADELGIEEGDLLAMLDDMRKRGVLSRVGAIVEPNTAGASTLAAMAIPAWALDAIADFVSSIPEVSHNYEREHRLNLWFVITASDRARIEQVLRLIEYRTSMPVVELPLVEAFHLDTGFKVQWH